MTTVDEALAGFERDWVEAQPVTPRTAYRRTLRLLRLHLDEQGIAPDAPLEALDADRLRGFVVWHRQHALADDAAGTRKAAVHVARLGEHLARAHGAAGLDLGRDELRALAPDEEAV